MESSNEAVIALEQRYIKLLEQRIADLEVQVQGRASVSASKVEVNNVAPSHSTTSTTNGISASTASPNEGVEGSAETKAAKKSPTRYKIVRSRIDTKTFEAIDEPIEAEQAEQELEVDQLDADDIAFTFRKIAYTARYDAPDPLFPYASTCEIEIHTKPLQDLLAKFVSKYLGKRDIPLLLPTGLDFKALIWSWDEALAESSNDKHDDGEEGNQARKDLHELLNTISKQSGIDHLQQYFRNRETRKQEKVITFDHLWTLFPPGTEIIGRPFMDQNQMFIVHSCDGWSATRSKPNEYPPCKLRCYALDWNGTEFNRVPFEMTIDHFSETKSIIDLPVFPVDEYVSQEGSSDVDKLMEDLKSRGRRYHELCTAPKGKQMFSYKGRAVRYQSGRGVLQDASSMMDLESLSDESIPREPNGAVRARGRNRVDVKGIVMVDFASYFEYQSMDKPFMGHLHRYSGNMECSCPTCRSDESLTRIYRPDWDHVLPDKAFTDEQFLFCPPRVLGYSMERKQWLQFEVQQLREPPKADAEVFQEKLQLDSDYKMLIRNAVMAHEAGKGEKRGRAQGISDFVEGKGRGLIILLYGLPGVGKTLTAESVAGLAGKPLFPVGVSEIGIEGAKIEANLQKIFDLASLWQAVLLFDEADVFLEARGSGENDLKRNAMVSVLLRVLEYYEGILILTTNRLKSLDIAAQSRIHLAIKYEDLDQSQREAIFMAFLEQLSENNLCDLSKTKRGGIVEWVKKEGCRLEFNGRQIRNVVSTALAMTRINEDGKPTSRKLHVDDLRDVARQTEKFKKDLHAQEAIFREQQMSRR